MQHQMLIQASLDEQPCRNCTYPQSERPVRCGTQVLITFADYISINPLKHNGHGVPVLWLAPLIHLVIIPHARSLRESPALARGAGLTTEE